MKQDGDDDSTGRVKRKRGILFARDERENVFIVISGPAPDLTEGDAITADEALAWFRDAAPKWPSPEPASTASFVHLLNCLRISEAPNPNGPAEMRIGRVRAAIRTLLTDLPPLIGDARRDLESSQRTGAVNPAIPTRINAFAKLLEASDAVASFLPLRSRRRKRDAPWHEPAKAIASSALAAWRKAGAPRNIGDGNEESPVVFVVCKALVRVGEGHHSHEAIVKALHRHPGSARLTFTLRGPGDNCFP